MMRYLVISLILCFQSAIHYGQLSIGPVVSTAYSKVLWIPERPDFIFSSVVVHQKYRSYPAFGVRIDIAFSDHYTLGGSIKYSFSDHHHVVDGVGFNPLTDLTYQIFDTEFELQRLVQRSIFALFGFKHQVFSSIDQLRLAGRPNGENYANAAGLGYRLGIGYGWKNLRASLTYNHLYNYTGKWHIQYDANKIFDLQVYYLFQLGKDN